MKLSDHEEQQKQTKTKTNKMSEPTPINDPLAMPAGQLEEPSFPVLREGVKRMVIRGVEKKQSDKDGKIFDYLSVKLATTADDRSTEDTVLHSGFSFNAMVSLTPNENNTIKQVAEQAAMVVKAALGKDTKTSIRDVINQPDLLKDKVVDVKIGIRKDKSGQYGDSNVVKAWIVPS